MSLPSLNEHEPTSSNAISPPLHQTLLKNAASAHHHQQQQTKASALSSPNKPTRISVVAEGDEDNEEVSAKLTNGTLRTFHSQTATTISPRVSSASTIRTSYGIALSEKSDVGSVTSHTALIPPSSSNSTRLNNSTSLLKRGPSGRFNQSEKFNESKGLQGVPPGISDGLSRPHSTDDGPMFGLRSREIQR